jgi:hypothetical protein
VIKVANWSASRSGSRSCVDSRSNKSPGAPSDAIARRSVISRRISAIQRRRKRRRANSRGLGIGKGSRKSRRLGRPRRSA